MRFSAACRGLHPKNLRAPRSYPVVRRRTLRAQLSSPWSGVAQRREQPASTLGSDLALRPRDLMRIGNRRKVPNLAWEAENTASGLLGVILGRLRPVRQRLVFRNDPKRVEVRFFYIPRSKIM